MADRSDYDERPPAEQLAAEQRLAAELGSYEGQWVAVRRSRVIAAADTLAALLAAPAAQSADGVFQVVSGPFFGVAAA